MHQTSPGVERAILAAKAWSERLGAAEVRLVDYLLGLLDEEEGRAAMRLERLGLVVADVREALVARSAALPNAAPLSSLFDRARDWSIGYRADPVFMTDALLLAVLQADPGNWQGLAGCERLAERIAAAMAAEDGPVAVQLEAAHSFVPPASSTESAGRVLDANLNRSREALRVLEDYCRFVLEDRFLTQQVKEMRHDLAEALTGVSPARLLAERETQHDVGTSITAPGEFARQSPAHVAAVNLKRLQESLRSLEEYGKLLGPDPARALETIRYRAYTLERAIVLGSSAREKLAGACLYVLLTGAQCAASLDWVIERSAAGGAMVFQLREKELCDRELLDRAHDIRRLTRQANSLFIVNDRPDIARLVHADGVHLGQDDMSVKDARAILGAEALIGVSTHSLDQVRRAVLDGADYIGVGPVFPSQTKAFEAFPGLDFIRAAAAETTLPAFALGGIAVENVAQVVAAGARRIAVGSAIAGAEDPELIARALCTALKG